MSRLFLQRLYYSCLALLGVATIVFILARLTGDPIFLLAPMEASDADIARIRQAYDLDQPLPVQYVRFLGKLVRGDLGYSYRMVLPVRELVLERVWATLQLALGGTAFALVMGVPLGLVAAVRRGSRVDMAAMFLSLAGLSVPSFWLGLMLIIVFGVTFPWLPVSGYGTLRHLLLPSFVLGTFYAAQLSRLSRTSFLDVLSEDYIRTARSKGLPNQTVLLKHALRNAALPILTVLGLSLGRMLSGVVVIETIFAWPGIGRLAVQAVVSRDFSLVQGVVILSSAIFLAINFVVDMLYGLIDPRIRAAAS